MFDDSGPKFSEIEFEFGLRNEPAKALLSADFSHITEAEIDRWLQNYGQERFVASLIQAYIESDLADSVFDRLGYLFTLYPEIIDELQEQLFCLCSDSTQGMKAKFKLLYQFSDLCNLGFEPESFKENGAAKTFLLEAYQERTGEISIEILNLAKLLSVVGSGVKNSLFGFINEYVLYGTYDQSPDLYMSIFRGDNEAITRLLEHLENAWYRVESPWELVEPIRMQKSNIDINSLARIEALKEKLLAVLS